MRRFATFSTLMMLVFPLALRTAAPPVLAHGARSTSALGQVQAIKHGLSVTRPHGKAQQGHVKQPLGNQYQLQTKVRQLASIKFQDDTLLRMNQNTSLMLQSPHLTYVKQGEVDEALVPGTDHRVQTPAAVASAIGTNFDVRVVKHTTIFVVAHGSLLVQSAKGSVLVKKNHETTVQPNQAPTPPAPADASADTSWTDDLPPATGGDNVAIDADGGQVLDYSSQDTGNDDSTNGEAGFINDGTLTEGWLTAPGEVTNQWVKLGLAPYEDDGPPPVTDQVYALSAVVIDPAATHGTDSSADLKDFEIRVSTTGIDDSDFTTVLQATCAQADTLQRFALPAGTTARFVELVALSNYGSTDQIAVAELEVVGVPTVSGSQTDNLIVNGDAETGPGAPDATSTVPVPGWTVNGNFTAVQYGAAGLPSLDDPTPADAGNNFFAGGPSNTSSGATQHIDVSDQADDIDAGAVSYVLSGFLGGLADRPDNAVLSITFKSASGTALDSDSIGPITPDDRNDLTALLPTATSGQVPPGTRSIDVSLVMTGSAGDYNDGFADDLSLILITQD